MVMLIDTHIHFDAPELHGRGFDLLPGARAAGIGSFVIPGVRSGSWQQLLAMVRGEPGVYAAPGLHPVYAEQWSVALAQQLRCACFQPKVVAIGEIGLDGVAGPALVRQEQVFRAQLEIAREAALPVLLHSRKTTGRVVNILRDMEIGPACGGIWHGFSASTEVARQLVAMGFLLGVGPLLLRANARRLPEAVCRVPLTALVLETDLPDMAATPAVLREVAARLARLRQESVATIITTTSHNARRLLRLPPDV